jgi:hypothetical protein
MYSLTGIMDDILIPAPFFFSGRNTKNLCQQRVRGKQAGGVTYKNYYQVALDAQQQFVVFKIEMVAFSN